MLHPHALRILQHERATTLLTKCHAFHDDYDTLKYEFAPVNASRLAHLFIAITGEEDFKFAILRDKIYDLVEKTEEELEIETGLGANYAEEIKELERWLDRLIRRTNRLKIYLEGDGHDYWYRKPVYKVIGPTKSRGNRPPELSTQESTGTSRSSAFLASGTNLEIHSYPASLGNPESGIVSNIGTPRDEPDEPPIAYESGSASPLAPCAQSSISSATSIRALDFVQSLPIRPSPAPSNPDPFFPLNVKTTTGTSRSDVNKPPSTVGPSETSRSATVIKEPLSVFSGAHSTTSSSDTDHNRPRSTAPATSSTTSQFLNGLNTQAARRRPTPYDGPSSIGPNTQETPRLPATQEGDADSPFKQRALDISINVLEQQRAFSRTDNSPVHKQIESLQPERKTLDHGPRGNSRNPDRIPSHRDEIEEDSDLSFTSNPHQRSRSSSLDLSRYGKVLPACNVPRDIVSTRENTEESIPVPPRKCCQQCAKQKKLCDRQQPCERCRKSGLTRNQCIYGGEDDNRKIEGQSRRSFSPLKPCVTGTANEPGRPKVRRQFKSKYFTTQMESGSIRTAYELFCEETEPVLLNGPTNETPESINKHNIAQALATTRVSLPERVTGNYERRCNERVNQTSFQKSSSCSDPEQDQNPPRALYEKPLTANVSDDPNLPPWGRSLKSSEDEDRARRKKQSERNDTRTYDWDRLSREDKARKISNDRDDHRPKTAGHMRPTTPKRKLTTPVRNRSTKPKQVNNSAHRISNTDSSTSKKSSAFSKGGGRAMGPGAGNEHIYSDPEDDDVQNAKKRKIMREKVESVKAHNALARENNHASPTRGFATQKGG